MTFFEKMTVGYTRQTNELRMSAILVQSGMHVYNEAEVDDTVSDIIWDNFSFLVSLRDIMFDSLREFVVSA